MLRKLRRGGERHCFRSAPWAPAPIRLRRARESRACAAGRGFVYRDVRRRADRGRGDAGADPRAGDPAGLEGGLDLPRPARAHPGDRDRRRRAASSTSTTSAGSSAQARAQVRGDARVRRRAAAAAPRRDRATCAARGCRASGRWPARCACSTSASSAIGGEDYAEENESYGAGDGPPRARLDRAASEVVFDFPAKSGQRRVQSIRDPAAIAAIEAMRRRRSGPEDLLAWREGRRVARRPLRRRQRLHPGEDRRGVLGQGLPHLARHRARRGRAGRRAEPPPPRPPRSARSRRAVERVAEALGNTPAVCRRSYIDPRVLDRFRDGETISPPPPATAASPRNSATRSRKK